jgi:hypothetical protein
MDERDYKAMNAELKNQTAVEWLEKAIALYVERCDLQEDFDKAKQMEKQQIIDFADDYGTYLLQGGIMSAIIYQETYKK